MHYGNKSIISEIKEVSNASSLFMAKWRSKVLSSYWCAAGVITRKGQTNHITAGKETERLENAGRNQDIHFALTKDITFVLSTDTTQENITVSVGEKSNTALF